MSLADSTPQPHVHGHGGSGAMAIFTKKYGPLPGWGWAAIVLVGIVGFDYYLRSKRASTTGTNLDDTIDGTNGTIASLGDGTLDGTSTTGNAGATGTASTETNAAWGSRVASAMIGQGKYAPSDITNAINAFLNGGALTPAQQAIVNDALSQFGEPPQGLIPVVPATAATTVTTKPAAPVTTPAKGVTKTPAKTVDPRTHTQVHYTVAVGDTLAGVASRFGTTVAAIESLNKGVVFKHGAVLRVPTAVAKATGNTTYRLKTGDTEASVAKRFGITEPELLAHNNGIVWKAGTVVHIPIYK